MKITDQMILEMWELYCELGSELESDEWTFLTQFFNKVEKQGTEFLSQEQILAFLNIYKKYSDDSSFDSGMGGMS